MVFEKLHQVLNTQNSSEKDHPTTEQKSTETTESSADSSSTGLNRPPGWDELIGSFEKPVIPIEDRQVDSLLEGLDTSSKMTSFTVLLPPMGVNDEHIQLHCYTVKNTVEERRSLVIDVHIDSFSKYLPEDGETDDGHIWEYPMESLTMCGPYYMDLADNLASVFRIRAMQYSLVEYDEDSDYAIFSGDVECYWTEKPPVVTE